MGKVVGGIAIGAGAAGTAAAILVLPSARYGDLDVPLHRFSGWGWYLAAAIGLHLVAGWSVVGRGRHRGLLISGGVALAASTVGAIVALMLRYDDATALLGPIVPMVMPELGPGGLVGLVSTLASSAPLAVPPGPARDRVADL